MKHIYSAIFVTAASLASLLDAQEQALPLSNKDYSFGYWENGYRKHKGDESKDLLCIETGYFGLKLDIAALDKAEFGLIDDNLSYEEALDKKKNPGRMQNLQDTDLKIELEQGGKIYTAVGSQAAKERAAGEKFQGTWLWESARYAQNYEIQGLEFKSKDGEVLVSDSSLQVMAWPNSLSFTAKVSPAVAYRDGAESGMNGKALSIIQTPQEIEHEPGLENEKFTVESWIKVPKSVVKRGRGWILCKTKNETNDGNYGFTLSSGSLRAMMNIGGRSKESRHFLATKHKTIQPGVWYHIAMTYDGNVFSLYVNGSLKDSKVIGMKRNLASGSLSLGQRADGFGGITPVVFDQLRVWDKALNRGQILGHYNEPTNLKDKRGLTYENEFETDEPVKRVSWKDAKLSIKFGRPGAHQYVEKKVTGVWKTGEQHTLRLKSDSGERADSAVKVTASMKLNNLDPVTYSNEFDCYMVSIKKPRRDKRMSVNGHRNYDEIDITVDSDKSGAIPFLLELYRPVSITGLCPILCDENGVPTGIPVQLSKNWHETNMGAYLRSYMMIPTSKGQKKYKLRIVYGFYGTVPSASHSQLSLVGYGGNGRWDQLAIGAWGETYCMDMDMSCVDVAVTDVRMLMARNGLNGKKWQWTDAGWGGDWLGLNNSSGEKLLFKDMKTAYMTHGPCMSDVKYDGYYGANSEVEVSSTVRTLRTNDHARTFTTLKYTFDKPVKADGWLFKIGRSHNYITPKVSYGNKAGLIKEHKVSSSLKAGDTVVPKTTLKGVGPWWVAFPGATINDGRTWGTGYKALVIRSYKAKIGGEYYFQPVVEFPVYKAGAEGVNTDFLLRAPEGVTEFKPGDEVSLDVELVTFPNKADDYYGSNEAFRNHVTKYPASWRTTHREAVGNDLKVRVTGGKLQHSYPVIIKAENEEVKVDIIGGLGYVPIRFEGLKRAEGYSLYQMVNGEEVKLDQSVHGNDFWQTDYDSKTGTFNITFNVLLDGLGRSEWVFKK